MLLPDCGVLVPDLLLSGVAIEVAVLVAVDSFSTSIFPSDVREDDLLFLSERSSSSPSESVYVAVNDCNTEIEDFDIAPTKKLSA
jgi:hypothetical protein